MPCLLFVVNDIDFFLSHRLPLALGAMGEGFEVHLAAADGPSAAEVQRHGLAFHGLPMTRSGMHPLDEVRTLAELVRLYRRVRPDLVHHVTPKPILYGSLVARLVGIRGIVNAPAGLGWVFNRRGLRADVLRLGFKQAYRFAFMTPRSRTVFQNPDDRAELVDGGYVDREHTVLIKGSGVDLERFAPEPEPPAPVLVVLPARMLLHKGIAEFVAAAATLRGSARFALVGAPDTGNRTAVPPATLRGWQDAGTVEWWGHQSDMPRVYAQSHIVCLPSYREGLPKSLIEAAACARPIVATDVPGCREIVRHGHNGLLVPARESAELAAALGRLIADGAERRRLGANGRALAVAEFSVASVVADTLAIYRTLLAS